MAEFFNLEMSTDEDCASFLARVLDIRYRLKQLSQDISDEMVVALVSQQASIQVWPVCLNLGIWADRTACTFESFQGKLASS